MRHSAGSIIVAAMIVAAFAQTARAQGLVAEGGIYYEDTDLGAAGSNTSFGVQGYYAFGALNAGDGPLNEALFLSPVPYAGLRVGTESGDIVGNDFDGTTFAILGGYADPGVPVAVDLVYTMTSIDMTGGSADITTLEFQAGYFVMPGLEASLVYDTSTMTVSPGSFKTVNTGIGVAGKWVKAIGGGQAFNAELKYESLTMTATGSPDEDGSLLEIGGDFYVTPTIGFGLAFTDETGETSNDGGQQIEIRASWFATPQVGLRVSHATYTPNASGADDQTTFTFGVFGRF